jgi:hypothetical protein
MNKKIDELTIELWKNSVNIFEELRRLQMLCLNIRISVARIGDIPDARVLAKSGEILVESLKELEHNTETIRNLSKLIAQLNKEEV